METVKRPSCQETDEDLLKQQEIFLKNSEKLSVNLEKKSKSQVIENEATNSSETLTLDKQDDNQMVVHEEEFILDVQENTFASKPFVFQLPSVSPNEVLNLFDRKSKSSKFSVTKQKKKSMFAQLMEEKKELNSVTACSVSSTSSLLIDGSGLKNSFKEVKNIHEENSAKISAMSEEEIRKYQLQLKSTLDSSLIQFIQSKRKPNKDLPQKNKEQNSSQIRINYNNLIQCTNENLDDVTVLRKDGKRDCDALILEKTLEEAPKPSVNEKNSHKSKHIELPEETKKLLELGNKRKWKNMDKIEKEKLEWLSELPKPNPIDLKTGYTARFDFEGKLLAHDVDIPTHEGLHHHGKEPEVAGYSLEELFLLARSTLQSQRITALHTLAHILDHYWYGQMDSCFDCPLLHTLLDAGIVPLLRWALDDTSVTSVAATVTAIHSLLICKADEACLHKTFCWLNGHLLPRIEPTGLEEPNIVMEELTDADLIKLDVIKGFLRIDILPRFLYIFQVMQPPPLVCKLMIEILCHLAQHSYESSSQVANYPGMLNIIFEKFLPISWQYVDGSKLIDTVNYSCPSSSAMKLIRILASSNKELAYFIIDKFEIEKVITVYLTLRPMDEKLSEFDVQNVMVETLKSLQVFLCYGMGFNIFLDLYPIFLRQMEFFISLSLGMEETKHCKDFEYGSHFFKTLEAVVNVSSQMNDSSSELKALLNAIFKQTLLCLKKWLHEMKQEKPSDMAVVLMTAALNFVSTYYEKSHKRLTCDDWEPCSVVKDMYTNYLIPSINSEVFKNLLSQIQTFSLLLNNETAGNKRDSKTIVSLASIMWEGDVVPLLKEGTVIPLLLAITNFIYIHKTLFNNGDCHPVDALLLNDSILEYLRKISVKELSVCSWFSRFEIHLIALFLKLSPFISSGNSLEEWHKVAVSILPILKEPDEYLVKDLFENIIFNEAFLPSSTTENAVNIVSVLPVIAECYTSYFLSQKPLLKSRRILDGSFEIDSLASLSNPEFMLPKDWCYAPIFDLYHNSSRRETSEALSAEDKLLVTSSLQWILLCHELSLQLLKDISALLEFCYLSMVFLLDWDCFRCPKIKSLLEANLLSLLKNGDLNFSKVVSENISSFNDFYLELLNQFEAVSYGDILFGNYILIPLQQCYLSRCKKVLLTDHSDAIAFLRVPLAKLIVPVEKYLTPFETDVQIIKEYLILLMNGTLTHQRCPLLYLMAVHHINHFIFLKDPKDLKSQKYLILNIAISKKEMMKRHLLLYSKADIQSEFGFVLHEKLSENKEKHLNYIIGQPVKL